MESTQTTPLLVICGPTASGKSSIAMQVAAAYEGEIICADSRTVYKGMDIGTAKPSRRDQEKIAHHLLDVVEPGDVFTAYDFQQQAKKAIGEIRSRKKVPIIVGGTGLYIEGLIYDYSFSGPKDAKLREELEKMSLNDLYQYSYKNNIELPENKKNKRYVVRKIERANTVITRSMYLPPETTIVGITTNSDELRHRITQRIEYMFEHGIVEEASKLGKKYGWSNQAMTGNIYPLIRSYIDNEITISEAKDKAVTLDWRLAKRQLTWLKRNKDIRWITYDQAAQYISDRLADFEQK